MATERRKFIKAISKFRVVREEEDEIFFAYLSEPQRLRKVIVHSLTSSDDAVKKLRQVHWECFLSLKEDEAQGKLGTGPKMDLKCYRKIAGCV